MITDQNGQVEAQTAHIVALPKRHEQYTKSAHFKRSRYTENFETDPNDAADGRDHGEPRTSQLSTFFINKA